MNYKMWDKTLKIFWSCLSIILIDCFQLSHSRKMLNKQINVIKVIFFKSLKPVLWCIYCLLLLGVTKKINRKTKYSLIFDYHLVISNFCQYTQKTAKNIKNNFFFWSRMETLKLVIQKLWLLEVISFFMSLANFIAYQAYF